MSSWEFFLLSGSPIMFLIALMVYEVKTAKYRRRAKPTETEQDGRAAD